MRKPVFALSSLAAAALGGCVVQQSVPPVVAVPNPASQAQAAAAQGQAAAKQAVAASLPTADVAAAKRLLSPDETLQALDFAVSGSKTVSGRIQGYKSASYAVPIRKGQTLKVTMQTKSTSAYFNIQDARDTSGQALFAGEASNSHTAQIKAAEDATYVVRPYLNRAVARRGSAADYTLKIERQ